MHIYLAILSWHIFIFHVASMFGMRAALCKDACVSLIPGRLFWIVAESYADHFVGAAEFIVRIISGTSIVTVFS